MLKNKIGIIIVGFNSKKYLPDCLGSIFNSSFKNYKVYFIDNNSSDNSVDYIEKNFKTVEIIKLDDNYGFAKANNIGSQKAIEDGCESIFLLNPDTLVEKNCLELLYESRKSDAIFQPLILLHEDGKKTDLINTSGNVLHFLGISYVGNYRKNYKEKELEKEIALASGAAMFIPALIIKKIGLFDEDFFMYHEDVDFCWRARKMGFNVMLLQKSFLWHKYNFSKNQDKFYYIERNRILFLLKNMDMRTLLIIFPIFLLNEIIMCFYALISGWFIYKMKGYLEIIRLFRSYIKKRNFLVKVFVLRDSDLKNYISHDIKFADLNSCLIRNYSWVIGLYWNIVKGII